MRLFLLVPDAVGKLDGRLFSPLASLRLRCLEIAPHLAKLGHRPRLIIDRDVPAMIRDGSFHEADAYINFKTTYNLEAYLSEAVDRGKPVLVDICDNVFHGPDTAANEALLSVATLATTPTPVLADMIKVRGATALEIPDCIEGEGSQTAPSAPTDAIRLIWFGRRQNAAPLLTVLADIARQGDGLARHLTVVCDDAPDLARTIRELQPDLSVDGIEWSPAALAQVLLESHVVLTPMSEEPAYITKSFNRLAHALWHDRPVATQPFPSLGPLAQFVTVSSDLGVAIDEIAGDWPATLAKTEAGRHTMADTLHPAAVARHWDSALKHAMDLVRTQDSKPRRETGIRLNIGCGDKLLPYYINIDAAPAREGHQPDMICDARDLSSFEDNSVDEVLSVHLIEHLSREDAAKAVAEWVRVLKPGGQLIIECPNILSACEALLKAPEAALQQDGEAAQRTMWAFYGDPSGGDPLMMHKWGYTPESAVKLLSEAGLVDVLSEAPRFKLGAPRDLRVVGTKAGI